MGVRRRHRKSQREIVAGEIELLPMLNVFISIIPLLLLSAAFVQVAVIQTSLPAPADAAVSSSAAAEEVDAPFLVSIRVRDKEYVVSENDVVRLTIPRPAAGAGTAAAADGARQQLKDALRALASAHAGKREVHIVAEPTTKYEDIVDVMDVTRAAGLPEAGLADASQGAS